MQKTDNRTNGGRFEQELSHQLAEAGFWCHVMQQNKAGQPADIICVKGKYHTLIDCKVISDDKGFPFSRIEENQRSAMHLFTKRTSELCYFAFKLPDETVWLVSLSRMETLEGRGKKRLTDEEIRKQTWSLESWLKSTDDWSKDI